MNKKIINKHSSLLGYSGHCMICGTERRIYKANAQRRLAKAFKLVKDQGIKVFNVAEPWANCINCLTKHQKKYTIKYRNKLTELQVFKDFDVMMLGFALPKKHEFKSVVRAQEKEDSDYRNFEMESAERVEFLKKRNPMAY